MPPRSVLAWAAAAGLVLTAAAGAVIAVVYALADVGAAAARQYPNVIVCPSGTTPWARYEGSPLGRSVDVECFDPYQAQSPVAAP